jgi:hypothetical protein
MAHECAGEALDIEPIGIAKRTFGVHPILSLDTSSNERTAALRRRHKTVSGKLGKGTAHGMPVDPKMRGQF